tara:strand:+ start:2677 stop:4128 length:1452 start_codon:yes stop_codon:yes gene_type:complete
MEMQIIRHSNWFRDFVTDMGRRGPTHLRDMPQHCPSDNEDNIFGKRLLVDAKDVDKSKPFAYLISIDGCDEDTLAELMYYGREMLLQDIVRSPISDEARQDLKTNPKSSFVIENTAEGHASFELFNVIHVLVALLDVPYEKVLYTNSTSNIEECYDKYLLNRPYALIERINVFSSGEWNEMVCQKMIEDTYELECQDDYCEWGDPMKDEWYNYMNINKESTRFLNNIHPELNRPHLFMYKHMNAKRGHRTAFMALLNDRGLLDGNLFSTPNDWNSTFVSGEVYLRKHFWERKQYQFYNEYLERLYKLESKVPTSIDRDHNMLDFDPNTNFSSDQLMYFNARRNCDIEIIGESEFNGSKFITEKFFKAIIFKQPFIMLGTHESLPVIRNMGYRTFSPFINEGYDGNDDIHQRMNMIAEEVERLTNLKRDPVKWQEWYSNITEIITYNYNTYINNLRKLRQMTTIEEKMNGIGGLKKAYDEMINR